MKSLMDDGRRTIDEGRRKKEEGRGRPFKGGTVVPLATRLAFCLLLGFVLLLMVACNGGETDEGPSDLALTATALAQGVVSEEPTSAIAAESQAGETPPPPAEQEEGEPSPLPEEPEEQEQSTGSEEVDDLSATATALAIELQATADAVAAAEAEAAAILAATEEPIRNELAAYGVTDGQLTYLYEPITLEETEFEDYVYDEPSIAAQARNFVVAADITWNSRFAESGCGFAVRSNANPDALNQYLIGLTRGAQGHVLFAEQVNGDVDLDLVTDIYANGIDPQFEWQNDTTNRIAVVGRGQEFTVYSNGTNLGTITGQSGLEDGFVAFFTLNRSGGIRCHFDNAWLWEMN
jgi:hypothetical protein